MASIDPTARPVTAPRLAPGLSGLPERGRLDAAARSTRRELARLVALAPSSGLEPPPARLDRLVRRVMSARRAGVH